MRAQARKRYDRKNYILKSRSGGLIMPNQTYDEKFRSLTDDEIIVLNAKCKGVAFDEIARRMGYGVKWVYSRLSKVYLKLGIDQTLHPRDRAKVLSDEVCPQLQEFLKNKPT